MSATSHDPSSSDRIALKGLRKRPIVDTSTAETIGRVDAVTIDPAAATVTGIVVRGGSGGVVPLARVQGIGADAVTVPAASSVAENGDEGVPRDTDAYGSRVLDERGNELGTLTDLLIDSTGAITSVVVDETPMDRRLMGIGSYAVIVGAARG